MSLKIYLACSLTHVPRNSFANYVKRIHEIAKQLKSCNVKYALINSDPQLESIPEQEKAKYCYLWDRKMVEESNLIIAEASYASIGLGIELQIAEINNIPIILIYNENKLLRVDSTEYTNPDQHTHKLQVGNGYVSLMALGLPNIFKVLPYNDINKCIKEIQVEIDKLNLGDN